MSLNKGLSQDPRVCVCVCVCVSCSVVSNSLQPHGLQVPLSMEFSKQKYWSR